MVSTEFLPTVTDVNPSAWRGRVPVAALAIIGCGIASYLALYQLGLVAHVVDPLFGSRSSEAVITSPLSRALPIPDAALGAIAYLLDATMALIGGKARWRTDSWLVLAFGLVGAGLVVAGAGLIIVQVAVVHAGCTLCLASAALSFTNGWLSRSEVGAALHHVRRNNERGSKS